MSSALGSAVSAIAKFGVVFRFMVSRTRQYHHGDLCRAVLKAAVAAIEESGLASLSLRDLARRAELSHAASAYHFGDKAGVLTSIAAEGYDPLADALEAQRQTGNFLEVGVACVRFATSHRALFDVDVPA